MARTPAQGASAQINVKRRPRTVSDKSRLRSVAKNGRHEPASSDPGVFEPLAERGHLCEIPGKGILDVTGTLMRVAFQPWRPGLPLRQASVILADWHLHLRQTLGVEDLVLRDDIVDEEQVRRQRVDLVCG